MPCECSVRRVVNIMSWFFQLLASLAWVVSVFIYNSWGVGDALQLTAAAAWTTSNFLSLPDVLGCYDRKGVKETESIEMTQV